MYEKQNRELQDFLNRDKKLVLKKFTRQEVAAMTKNLVVMKPCSVFSILILYKLE